MPRLDGTGPEGEGPRTGRGMGKCSPEEEKVNKLENVNRPRRKFVESDSVKGTARNFNRGQGANRGQLNRRSGSRGFGRSSRGRSGRGR